MNTFSETVYQVTRAIPSGKVATYGQIAHMVGHPRASRVVGQALHKNPDPGTIPCHRVVFADGSLSKSFAFGGENVQRALLEAEGVRFTGASKVDMENFQWQPS